MLTTESKIAYSSTCAHITVEDLIAHRVGIDCQVMVNLFIECFLTLSQSENEISLRIICKEINTFYIRH